MKITPHYTVSSDGTTLHSCAWCRQAFTFFATTYGKITLPIWAGKRVERRRGGSALCGFQVTLTGRFCTRCSLQFPFQILDEGKARH